MTVPVDWCDEPVSIMVKTTTRWLLAGLLCVALWPAPAHASELRDAYNRTNELFAEGRYREAIPFAKEALALGEEEFGPDHPNTAIFLNNLAAIYQGQGRYAEAEPLLQRALAIAEKASGPEHSDVAQSLSGLAILYVAQGRYAEAEPLHERALAIFEKAPVDRI